MRTKGSRPWLLTAVPSGLLPPRRNKPLRPSALSRYPIPKRLYRESAKERKGETCPTTPFGAARTGRPVRTHRYLVTPAKTLAEAMACNALKVALKLGQPICYATPGSIDERCLIFGKVAKRWNGRTTCATASVVDAARRAIMRANTATEGEMYNVEQGGACATLDFCALHWHGR